MASVKPAILKGTRDFGPAEMAKRNFIINTIKKVFQKYGFEQIETPAMETLSVLTGKYGDEGDQLLFKILNSGDFLSKTSDNDYNAGASAMLGKIAKKGLRYDLTVPFARYVVMNQGNLSFPFKRFQVQPVWRADRPQKGRYQEFYQCDADVIGTNSLLCEAEIIGMINDVFSELGLEQIIIKVNNRKILAGIAEAIGALGKEGDLCVAIDKLDKIGQEKVNEELEKKGFSEHAINLLAPILHIEGTNEEKLQILGDFLAESAVGTQGIQELQIMLDYAKQLGYLNNKLILDISLARGLSYYTGAIFEVQSPQVAIGSITGGGRYDDLTGVFGLKEMSGVGISFGIDRIYDVLQELALYPDTAGAGITAIFVQFDKAGEAYCLPLLQKLRNAGISAELYPEPAKMKKQMNYANKRNASYVILAGEDERAAGKFTLKNMASGEQSLATSDEILAQLKA